MKELSLNILDIAENSVKAGASLTEIYITEQNETLRLIIKDNGCGMSEDILKSVTDPFYTTRTTRKVGLGIPLLKLEAELTGGSMKIISNPEENNPQDHGTTVEAVFNSSHIDFTPLGDIISTIVTLIQGHPNIDFLFVHKSDNFKVELDTRELRAQLDDIPLDTYEVIKWIEEYLQEQYSGS